MSFSSDIKERLCATEYLCGKCAASELAALLGFAGHFDDDAISFHTENEAVAKRLIADVQSVWRVEAQTDFAPRDYRIYMPLRPMPLCGGSDCCGGAYTRGAFLAGGSVNAPEKGYHLEFATRNIPQAKRLYTLLVESGFAPKHTMRKDYSIVYFKDCDSIAELLGFMGEGVGGLKIFETQVEKQVRNNVNRLVNCENANTDKLAKASSKHIYAINKIKKANAWQRLPETLREMGELRCLYPEDSLKELGEKLSSPIGKSGVNHRLNRIMRFADNL